MRKSENLKRFLYEYMLNGLTDPKTNLEIIIKQQNEINRLKIKLGDRYKMDEKTKVNELQELNAWEQEFITDMEARFNKYGENTIVSEKQTNLLLRLSAYQNVKIDEAFLKFIKNKSGYFNKIIDKKQTNLK